MVLCALWYWYLILVSPTMQMQRHMVPHNPELVWHMEFATCDVATQWLP